MRFRARRAPTAVAVTATVLSCVLATPALAQYFGRNKVRWERFDFQVLKTEHFDIHYYPEETEAVKDAAVMAERWYDRLSGVLGHDFLGRKPILLYADHPDFQQTNATGGLISQGTGGFTEPLRDRVVLPMTGDYAETDHVLGHELVHAFQFDIIQAAPQGGRLSLERLPLWFVEGMAEYLSLGREDPHTAMWLRDAMVHDRIPTIRQLSTDPRFFPYRFGHAFWAYVAGRWGDPIVRRLFVASSALGVEDAIESVLDLKAEIFSQDWAQAIRATYGPLMHDRQRPGTFGEALLSKERGTGDVNLAPVLSPDGRTVAFLSTREIFTIEVYLADARTGRVLGKLFKTNADPHVDALRFIDSAGTWSPDGKKLAFAVFARGDNELAIVDAERRRIERQIALPGIGAFQHPAWSPDGRRIAFSGMQGGISDLYVLDVDTERVTRLTQDSSADLHPAWSPDGKTLAFTSDRVHGTDLDTLVYAPPGIVLLDLETGQKREVDTPAGAKAINPQFSPDGEDLYFISDRGGFSDVYRMELDTAALFQVTRLTTGASGITDLGPAFTVGREDGRLMFSVFEDGDYNVYALEPEQARGGTPLPVEVAGILPPRSAQGEGEVAHYLDRPARRTEEPASVTQYRRSLGLLYLAPPAVGVAVDRYGTGVGGAATAYFSDLLGDHLVGATLQATGNVKEIGGQVFYTNLKERWNWGVGVARIPYLSSGTRITETTATVDGEEVDALLIEQIRERTYLSSASLRAEYPFSTRRRIVGWAVFTRYDFDLELEQFLTVGGEVVGRGQQGLQSPEGFNLYGGSVALVGDSSFFGFTSPVRGGRYRLEAGTTTGELKFQTLLADWRRYLFARPVTFALRGLHFGRYGADAESPRISPLYVGYDTLVRGYSVESFDPADCTFVPEDPAACPEFDRLVGSRIAVANAELRVPLLGTEQYGIFNAPFLPTELAAFVDAGVAWTEAQGPELHWDRESLERIPVVSAGLSARLLLGGFIVAEFYYARPFQRGDGGVWGFFFAPGW